MAEKIKRTKGKFKIAGFINGTSREKFIDTKTFDSGATKQTCTFGVKTSLKNETWVTVEGFDSKKAKFQKYDNKEKKNYQQEVNWEDRFEFKEDGFNPMFGVSLLFKENNYKNLFAFDAVDELETSLEDNMPVYIEGMTDYYSYKNDKDEIRRFINFKPNKVRKSTKDIDFNNEDFQELNLFEQEIIFINIDQHPNQENRFVLEANVVTGSKNDPKIEDVEFLIDDKKLATALKKNLKPYHAIKVMGRLVNSIIEEDIPETEETWGDDKVEFQTTSAPRIKEMVITKAYKNSIDKESYSEELISGIKQADDSFGNSDWGESTTENDDVWGE